MRVGGAGEEGPWRKEQRGRNREKAKTKRKFLKFFAEGKLGFRKQPPGKEQRANDQRGKKEKNESRATEKEVAQLGGARTFTNGRKETESLEGCPRRGNTVS